MTPHSSEDQELFKSVRASCYLLYLHVAHTLMAVQISQLKACCVPLLGHSVLTNTSTAEVSRLLSQILHILQESTRSKHTLKPSIVAYVFFPISTILRRNDASAIPNQVLEKLFAVLAILCDRWWWDMDTRTWEQIFMLCGAVIGGLESKGKLRERDDETKQAAAECLWALLRKRNAEEGIYGRPDTSRRVFDVFRTFQVHSRSPTFIPVIGQAVDSLVTTSISPHLPLKRSSLRLLCLIVEDYLSDDFIPGVLPGIVSGMCKAARAIGSSQPWANAEVVEAALDVLRITIVRAISDDVCIKEGAVREASNLEDFVDIQSANRSPPPISPRTPYSIIRNASWLRGTSSQIHIALNSLSPLVSHPTPSALAALSFFARRVLHATSLTLPQSQSLLLSWLLSISTSDMEVASLAAEASLSDLLHPSSTIRSAILHVLFGISKDYLLSIPRLLLSHADHKVEHAAKILRATCDLTTTDAEGVQSIKTEIAKLLGPSGGIERWGWSLLDSLIFDTTPLVTPTSVDLLLESDGSPAACLPFPPVHLSLLSSRSSQAALEQMLQSLGRASGESGLYATEWFFEIARQSRNNRSVAAMWCGCRLMEGIGKLSLDPPTLTQHPVNARLRRLERFCRDLTRAISEFWDTEEIPERDSATSSSNEDQGDIIVEHVKGLLAIRTPSEISKNVHPFTMTPRNPSSQPDLHKALSLQAIAICAGVLQARFTSSLLHALYPVLHSLTVHSTHLSSTALSALHYISLSTSYASPANMLLSNFDYALDGVSRRLTRRWLDINASKVFAILVKLVGRDIVERANDVIDECFDRLDEFHGYEQLVDGLITVLLEVVARDENNVVAAESAKPFVHHKGADEEQFLSLFRWLADRRGGSEESSPNDEETNKTQPEQDEASDDKHNGTQILTKQVVSRSLYFLTHRSPAIRARILNLLTSAVPVLPASALLPSVHQAWPFILNRLSDSETFVAEAAVVLVEALSRQVGDFMYQRVWDDVWPRFRTKLRALETADSSNALARRGPGAVGTETAYSSSHRLYRAMLNTMKAAVRGIQPQDTTVWEVTLAFRRFLHDQAHEDLQAAARDLYKALSVINVDATWFALTATEGLHDTWEFLHQPRWCITNNLHGLLVEEYGVMHQAEVHAAEV